MLFSYINASYVLTLVFYMYEAVHSDTMEHFDVHNITHEAFENTTLNFSTTDVDLQLFLEQLMGEKRRDITSVGILTFVYVLIFITGISGNICTCIVIARNAYMHTATNYYLFSLAISDMLTLIFGK